MTSPHESSSSVETLFKARWSPLPLQFWIPVSVYPAGGLILNAVVVLGSFARYSWPLSDGKPRILQASLRAVSLMQILHWIYLARLLSGGMSLNATHTIAVCGINLALTIAIISTAIWCWKRPHFLLAIGFQWLIWFWFTMYSFPLLGDLVGGV